MGEGYTGVKFKTVYEGKEFEYKKERSQIVSELKKLGSRRVLDANNGNVSVKVPRGLIITPTGKDMSQIRDKDLILVTGIDEKSKTVRAIGTAPPSSEAIMHWLIYENFLSARAIVHFHDSLIMENHKKFIETKEAHPYGTTELAHAALKALKKSNFIILRDHGPLTINKDLESCHAMIERALDSV